MADNQLTLFARAAQTTLDQELTDIIGSLELEGMPRALAGLLTGSKNSTLAEEFFAVQNLLMADFSLPEIAKASGMSQHHLAQVLQMVRLPPPLFEGIHHEKLKRGIALGLLKLTDDEIQLAAATYARKEAFTGEDLEQIHSNHRARAVAELPASIFENVQVPGYTTPLSLAEELQRLHEQFSFQEILDALQQLDPTFRAEIVARPDRDPGNGGGPKPRRRSKVPSTVGG